MLQRRCCHQEWRHCQEGRGCGRRDVVVERSGDIARRVRVAVGDAVVKRSGDVTRRVEVAAPDAVSERRYHWKGGHCRKDAIVERSGGMLGGWKLPVQWEKRRCQDSEEWRYCWEGGHCDGIGER